jgi:hypothetical protein
MKRLVCAVLALSLTGATAAIADSYDHGNRGGSYSHQDRKDYGRGDNGARDYDDYNRQGYGYGGGSYYDRSDDAPGYGGRYGSSYRYEGDFARHHGYGDHAGQSYAGRYGYGAYRHGR